MAQIDGIGLAEPSTITKSLAAVPVTRNSSVTYQEVMVLGSPNSTTLLALAEVTGSAPASTTVGLVVRPVGPLTVAQSSAADLNVTVANFSTTVAVSSLGGAVIVRSSAADALVSVYQSTAGDLQATVTPVAGSTWRTQPGSTLWASSAGFHFNSSGDLKVEASFTGSTTVTVARIVGNSSAADAVPVRLVLADGSTYVQPAIDYTHGGAVTASSVTGPAVLLYASSAAPSSVTDGDMVLQWGTQHGAANVALVTSSGADMSDSSNAALRVNVVAGSAAGSTTVNVSSLGGAVIVRSSAANALVTAYQSTAADFNATITPAAGSTFRTQPGSTLWASSAGFHFDSSGALLISGASASTQVAVSSIAGAVIMRSSAADALVTVYQSTASALQATARVNTSSGGAVEGSTTTPAAGVLGLHIRQIYPTMLSTTMVITSTHSTAVYEVISSVAALRHKVYAYFIGSTHTNPSTLVFMSSAAGGDHWAVNFGSGSSGVTGANLAIAPPGYIFAGVAANALNVRVEGGSSVTSTVIVRVAISWFDEA